MIDSEIIDKLRYALRLYDRAAEKFIAKVDRGDARSTETYRDLKDALKTSKEAQ